MAEFLSAGVFIEEVKSQEQAILGVSTSNMAMVGWLPRGESNKATLVGSLNDYFRKFGGYWKYSDVPLAVTGFFKNDGTRGYIVRVEPSDAALAQADIPTNRWLIKAISGGKWGNQVRLVIAGSQNFYDISTGVYSRFDVQIQEESVDGEGDWVVTETFEAVDLADPDSADYFPLVLNDDENGSNTVRITEVSGGVPTQFAPTSVANESIGTGTGSQQLYTSTLTQVPVAKFSLKLKVNGTIVGEDNGRGKILMSSGVSGYTGVSGTVDYATGAFAVNFTPAVPASEPIAVDYIKAGASSLSFELSGGLDGTSVGQPEVSSSALAAELKGLYALDRIDEILNIGLPDFDGNQTVHQDLIDYVEGRKDCFAVLAPRRGVDAQDAVNYKRVTLASLSSYAAMYYPGIKVADPLLNGKPKIISPVGHILGVYARTDTTRNVGKAPAGVDDGRLNFALGLEFILSKPEMDILYPANVNPLKSSTQTGRCVWGARTLQIVGDFNLVNVRRLFLFLEKSTFNSTHDLVFEGIGSDLFTTVALRMNGFLGRLAQEGYFASRVPAEAFRVIVDETNNTPQSIAARQLITDILVAPQTPAEFVRFRFQRSLNKLS